MREASLVAEDALFHRVLDLMATTPHQLPGRHFEHPDVRLGAELDAL